MLHKAATADGLSPAGIISQIRHDELQSIRVRADPTKCLANTLCGAVGPHGAADGIASLEALQRDMPCDEPANAGDQDRVHCPILIRSGSFD